MLVILDGWGLREATGGNAIAQAHLPNYRYLKKEYPFTTLKASGEYVGLPAGQMGNSEVGHLNIGAGRVVYQELTRISRAIEDGTFFRNQVLLQAVEHAKRNKRALHLMGLLSDGGVHSHIRHLFALLDLARQHRLEQVFIHAFLDGRDVPPANAKEYFLALNEKLQETGLGSVATVMGRYYAMDRDKRWDRTEKAYRAMVAGEGLKAAMPLDALEAAYNRGETDEFVTPTVIVRENGNPVATVKPGDAVIFYNFRADRARQLTRAFVEKDFTAFDRPGGYLGVHFVCMTQYDVEIPAPVAFPPQNLINTLGEVLAKEGKRQLRIAETEKYAHVTFFFNGGVEEPNPGEDRILIPSPKVPTYNLKPEMSAYEVTETVLEKIRTGEYDVIILNFANPDMVGHTGIMEAAVKAVEAVDECIGRIWKAVRERDGILIITADHGNAEQMVDPETGESHTAHTDNPVPFILVSDEYKHARLKEGALKDIAPTLLQLLNISKPSEMTGESLLQEKYK
ncbi:2,3-bisphosphoglycerate-independent phosphoglycerate mutase [Calderihabitans maritimus]|nr:2,3-bisphosphoglycerate-independent phosphoglycerate mutase [Calderihabitans maritimus]